MTHRFLKAPFVALLVSLPVLLPAQADISGKEEERLEALARSEGEWKAPKSKISVGFRMLNSGGQVDFLNLGTVPSTLTVAVATDGSVARSYSNGSVRVDGLRAAEKDADGNQTSTPGGRYTVYRTVIVEDKDADGNVTGTHDVSVLAGDLLSYTPGLTREWEAATAAQVATPGYVSFSIYDVTSGGGSASHKQGATGGVELQFSRDIGRGSLHWQWGVVAGITLNDINSKSAGTVSSTLNTRTDYYSTNGLPITSDVQRTSPSFEDLLDADGLVVSLGGHEITVPINTTPDASLTTNVATVDGASVSGRWQVKGAYFMFKLGPSLRAKFTEHLAMTASLGLAGAYAGTRYSAFETYSLPQLPDFIQETTEESTASKFLKGYFADVNLEWSANETLGLFGGVTAQKLSDYTQKLGGRSARIDLGSAVGLRGGVSIRF